MVLTTLFLFFIVFLTNGHNVQAIVEFSDKAAEDLICPVKRTPLSIVWSCLATLLICAWASVHPNVPAKKKGLAWMNKLRVMFWMIIAPELVLAWAVRQRYAARKIRDVFNNTTPVQENRKNWKMIHGHFLGMGGLTLVDQHLRDSHPETQSNSARVLTPEELEGRLNNPDFQRSLTRITNDETEDRFKSDALSKIIAILQLMWFIIHCIARSQQGLALTELELVTVALASLNFVTYGIWWDKPLDVKEPVRILWTIDTEPVVPTSQATDDLQELSATCVLFEAWKLLKESASALYRPCLYVEEFLCYMFIILPLNVFYIVTFPLYVLFPWGIVLLLKIIETEEVNGDNSNLRIAAQMLATLQGWRHSISLLIRKPFQRRFKDSFLERGSTFFWSWFLLFPTMFILLLLFCVLFVPFSLSVSCFSFVSQSVFSIISTSTVHPHAAHVPTFYAPKTESDKFSRMVVFALSGVIFNGLNLLGWKLIYPTSIERTIWRATSLAITTIPFAVAPIDCLLENAEAPFPKYLLALDGRFGKRARYGLDFIMTILLFIYVPARLFLVAQAFALLRDQPTKALLIVDWTKYIPHLFS